MTLPNFLRTVRRKGSDLWSAGLTLVGLLIGLWFTFPTMVFAQGATGAINGTVTDSTGAVIPGAAVILHNEATGTEQSALTNEAGLYVFPTLIPGKYSLRVSKEGFTTVTEKGFTLAVNQTSTHDFTLSPGAVTQEITVSAAVSHLEASTSELGAVVQQSEVNNLPLNGRNFTQLLALTPGVSPISSGQNSGGGGGFTGNAVGTFAFPSVNGQCNRCNLWLFDGLTNYGYTGTYSIEPILETIQEFKVQSHNDVAAYGEVIGGIVNVVSRAGTAEYHGDIYEFLRNSTLDARNTFVPNRAAYKQNQFGGVFGGPLLPKHFRGGAPKTFFFVGYEGFRSVRAAQILGLIPTPAQLAGDLSNIQSQIYNPFSTRPDPNNPGQFIRDPFTNNQIPPNLIKGTANYAKLIYPTPQQTGIPGINLIDNTPNRIKQDTASLRLDQQFTERTSGWFRYTYFDQQVKNATGIPGIISAFYPHGYQAAGSITHTFGGGTKVANFRFNRNSAQANVIAQFPNQNSWQVGGFNSAFTTGFIGGFAPNPAMNIQGFTGIPRGVFQGNHYADIYEWAGDLTIVHGRHTFQTGGDFNLMHPTEKILFISEDYFAFSTANPKSPQGTGSALASFLLGVPTNFERRNLVVVSTWGKISGYYFQDQWKATDKLQVNVGFRYDLTLRPVYQPFASNDDTDTGLYVLNAVPPPCGNAPCIPGGLLPAHTILTPFGNKRLMQDTFDNWQPRLGLTYRLRPTTVIRASAGRFFENWAGVDQFAGNVQGSWPDVALIRGTQLNNPTPQNPTPTNLYDDPGHFGSGAAIVPAPTPFAVTVTTWSYDPFLQNPYSIQWNFGVQQQLGSNVVLEADYVGSHGSRLDVGAFRNTAVTPGPGNPNNRAPFPYMGQQFTDKSIGKSSYNAFQFKAERRTSRGLAYLVSYTWSKTIDLGCDTNFLEGCSVPDPYHLQENSRSVAGYDLPHMLNASWVYELPLGSGKRFTTSSRVLNYIVGNWALNGIFSVRSGNPFNVLAGGDIANTGGGDQRAKIVGPPYPGVRSANNFLNKASFKAPDPFTFGNLGRYALRTPHVTNWDLSLFKSFPLPMSESSKLEFRAEFFDAFNQQALGVPPTTGSRGAVPTVSDPNFGRTFTIANRERDIQFALKLYW